MHLALLAIYAAIHATAGTGHADDRLRLASQLQFKLKLTERAFTTFHYAGRGDLGSTELGFGVSLAGPLDAQDPKVSRHVQDWAAYYFQDFKRGLYLGLDPVTYRDFGKEHPVLYQVELWKGLRYLDFSQMGSASDEIDADSVKILAEKFGCAPTIAGPYYWSFFFLGLGGPGALNPNEIKVPACREIAKWLLEHLAVDAIFYQRGATTPATCANPLPKIAIVLLNTSPLSKGDVTYFSPDMPPTPAICEISRLMAASDKPSLWPEAPTSSACLATPADYEKRLLGCRD